MKNKKAINAIKENNCYGCYGSKEDCEMCAYGVAIEALEKRIPKKFYRHENDYCVCPNCDCQLTWHWFENYCEHCGQAISWSEVE